jgi:hypothetical protein
MRPDTEVSVKVTGRRHVVNLQISVVLAKPLTGADIDDAVREAGTQVRAALFADYDPTVDPH